MVKCSMAVEFTRHVLYIKIHKHTFFFFKSILEHFPTARLCTPSNNSIFLCVLSFFSASLLGFRELAGLTTNWIAGLFGPQQDLLSSGM